MIEKELKTRLKRHEYQSLRKRYRSAPTRKQTSYYFSSEKMAFRLRNEGASWTLTLKQSISNKGGFSTRLEWELPLPSKKAKELLKWRGPFHCLGKMENQRTRIKVKGLTLELDYTKLTDGHIFELEAEGSRSKVAPTLKSFLKDNEIPFRPENRSKFSRFRASLKKRKGGR